MQFPAKITLSSIWVAIPVDWVILHWYACGADGRAGGHVITKISRMGRLPHFLRYGATLARTSRVDLRYYHWDDHYVFSNYSSRWPVLIKTIGHLAFCMKEFTAIQKLLSSSNITSTYKKCKDTVTND